MGDFVDIISSPYPHGEGLPVYTDTQSWTNRAEVKCLLKNLNKQVRVKVTWQVRTVKRKPVGSVLEENKKVG
jgi:hypothetical protein